MDKNHKKQDILFRSWWQLALSVMLGFALCWVTVALMRAHGKDWKFPLTAGETWSIDPQRNPYEAYYNWKGIYIGDYQPIFEAAQGKALDPDFPMYQPEQLKEGRASFVYTPFTALVCVPISQPELTLQESSDIVSFVNHLMWIAGGLILLMILFFRARLSIPLAIAFVVLYLVYYPFAKALQLTQASVWIYFFLVLAVFLFQRGWQGAAGLALAIGVAIKPHLVVAPIVLFFTPNFPRKMLWWCAGGLAVCALASFLYAGWSNSMDYLTKTLPTLSAGYAYYPNQTLNGMLLRVFKNDYDPETFNLVKAHGWIKALGTLFFLGTSFVAWLASRNRPAEPARLDDMLALAIVMTAGVLASPVAWLHHFTALAITYVIVIRILRERPHLRSAAIEASLFLSFILTGWFFDTRDLREYPETLLSGPGFIGVIVLFGCLIVLARRNAGAAPMTFPRLASLSHSIKKKTASLPASFWFAIAAILVLSAANVLIYGHEIGRFNHSIQLPHLLQMNNPELYPGDVFMASMKDYFSFFWLAMAALVKALPMKPLFFAGHILTLIASYAAVFMLSKKASPEQHWAPFAAMAVFLFIDTSIGKEDLHWFYFAHTTLAFALGLWALYLGAIGRWVAAFALAGFIFNIHAMQSAYLLLMLGAAILPELKQNWKLAALSALAWALLAAPGLFWMLRSDAVGSPDDLGEAIRAFFPYHFFASSWHIWQWFGAILLLTAFGGVALTLNRNDLRQRLMLAGAALVVFNVLGGLLTELTESGFLIKLHIFRSSSYLAVITIVLFSAWLFENGRRFVRPEWRPGAALVLCLGIIVVGWSGYLTWGYQTLPWLLVLWSTIAIVLMFTWKGGARKVAAGVFAFFCFATILIAHYEREDFEDTTDWRQKHWIRTQEWARENTAPDAVFLTPPGYTGFRIWSERRPVGEWIEGAAMLWDTDFVPHWREWYELMGGWYEDDYEVDIWDRLDRKYINMPQSEIEAIASKADADYIVLRKPYWFEEFWGWRRDWDGEVLYRNDLFFVVRASKIEEQISENQ